MLIILELVNIFFFYIADNVFIPNFVEIKCKNKSEIMRLFRENGVSFPVVCKPLLAQGSSKSHNV